MDDPFAPIYVPSLSGISWLSAIAGNNSGINNSLTWVANLAVYMPFFLPVPYTAKRFYVVNSTSTTAQNLDIGIYSEDGIRIISTGSTAKTSGGGVQYITAAFYLTAGRYFFAYSNDSALASAVRGGNAAIRFAQMAGVFEESVFPLPASMTPVVAAHALQPLIGMTST